MTITLSSSEGAEYINYEEKLFFLVIPITLNPFRVYNQWVSCTPGCARGYSY
jgi:hypothetical protein